jgi:tripartite-type tricarboxylate transporter receptor subunit TctC
MRNTLEADHAGRAVHRGERCRPRRAQSRRPRGEYLGNQPIVVVNQPGASGAIGTLAVRNAPADGYTLLLARIASQVILPATDVKTPYQWNDFTQLSLLEVNPYVCAVKADAPWKSMKELTDEIAKRPGKLNFASVGAGTLQNFGPQYLFSLLGLPKDAAAGIAYKGRASSPPRCWAAKCSLPAAISARSCRT